MNVADRFHVAQHGRGTQAMVFAHGFACDQSMWRWVAPAFEPDCRAVLFDLAGCGRADPSAFDRARHASLHGYARDVLEIVTELNLDDVVYVGHSVSAMIDILAAIEQPKRFASLLLVGPSPCYVNDGSYQGGFSRRDIDGLIDALDTNYLGWASAMAPVIVGRPDRPDLVREVENSFCRMHPDIARAFARVTFLSDNRAHLARMRTRSLILQVTDDVVAPMSVAQFIHGQLRDSELVFVKTRGHRPHMSAPEPTIGAIRRFLASDPGHG